MACVKHGGKRVLSINIFDTGRIDGILRLVDGSGYNKSRSAVCLDFSPHPMALHVETPSRCCGWCGHRKPSRKSLLKPHVPWLAFGNVAEALGRGEADVAARGGLQRYLVKRWQQR